MRRIKIVGLILMIYWRIGICRCLAEGEVEWHLRLSVEFLVGNLEMTRMEFGLQRVGLLRLENVHHGLGELSMKRNGIWECVRSLGVVW